jgi:hypothetical protein
MHQKKTIIGINSTKFLGLELGKNISWKNNVQKILPKLSSACYLARRICICICLFSLHKSIQGHNNQRI